MALKHWAGGFLVFVILALFIGACFRPSQYTLTVRGSVVDDTTGAPVPDAIVVSHWSGHVSGFMTGFVKCYHVETTRTRDDGSYEVKARIPRPDVDDPPNEYPAIVVYKPGYQTSLSRIKEAVPWVTSLSEVTERAGLAQRVRYLVPTTQDRKERVRYLGFVGQAASCPGAGASQQNLLPLLTALRDDARAIAKTDYDQWVIRRLEWTMDVARGNADAMPPSRDLTSVIVTVVNRNPGGLARALALPTAEVDDRDERDRTALMLASFDGSAAMVRMLLQAGADPNKGNEEGGTALHSAVEGALYFAKDPVTESRYVDIIRALRAANVDVGRANVHGQTARLVAEQRQGPKLSAAIVELLE
jgi:Ankyrin repeats (many copies)